MKYLMQILLGLMLLQLLQSCDYSKSRDVLWMKKNFENNAELFFDVTNLFNPNRSLGFLCVVRQREIL